MAARSNNSFNLANRDAVGFASTLSVDSENSRYDNPVRSLKVFVDVPKSASLEEDDLHSFETLQLFSRIAAADGADSDENRPPSPRPESKSQAVIIHSEVLSNWEDSIRFNAKLGSPSCPATCSFRRTGSSKDYPLPMESLNVEFRNDSKEIHRFR